MHTLDQFITRYQDFPKESITFYDISPILENASMLSQTISKMTEYVRMMSPDLIAGIDARGFLLATPIAISLGLGAIMIRKQGKLPGILSEERYDLEYGKAALNLQKDRKIANKRIVIIDDLLATGGTLKASSRLITKAKGIVVGAVVLIELTELNGRNQLDYPIQSLQTYKK